MMGLNVVESECCCVGMALCWNVVGSEWCCVVFVNGEMSGGEQSDDQHRCIKGAEAAGQNTLIL